MDGDSEGTALPISEDWRYNEIRRLYGKGLSSKSRHHLNSVFAAERLKKLDHLFESIVAHGYLSQRDLLSVDRSETRYLNNDTLHPILNEIGVNIYGDGSLVRTGGGFHRHALALALRIRLVPVLVRARHAEWQAIRDEVAKARSIEELSAAAVARIKHPDLADLVHPTWLTS